MIGHLIIQPLMFLGVFFFFKVERGLHSVDEYYKNLNTKNGQKSEDFFRYLPSLLTNVIKFFYSN
jgi:hypothetical protein